MSEPTNIFYVQAEPDPLDPQRARCTFFTDYACTDPVKSPMSIPVTAGEAIFVQVATPNHWLLVGAVADRCDTSVIDPSFLPSTFNQVAVAMPVNRVISQGVLLIFSSQGEVTQLYSSSDPVIRNDGV
ncbi:hypothetical protein [Roseateles sp. BYS96W]|uniref:Uncharacterized protein n=1 Tax=Pelomonas nitida TaxID=3299027 RepID=A0ABW7G9C8_9BURK